MSFGKVSHNIPYILEKTKDNIDFDNYYLPLLGKAPKQIGLTIIFCKKGGRVKSESKIPMNFLRSILKLEFEHFQEKTGAGVPNKNLSIKLVQLLF